MVASAAHTNDHHASRYLTTNMAKSRDLRDLPRWMERVVLRRRGIRNSFTAPRGYIGKINDFRGTAEEEIRIREMIATHVARQIGRGGINYRFHNSLYSGVIGRCQRKLAARRSLALAKFCREIEATIPTAWCKYPQGEIVATLRQCSLEYVQQQEWSTNRRRNLYGPRKWDKLICRTVQGMLPTYNPDDQSLTVGCWRYKKLRGHSLVLTAFVGLFEHALELWPEAQTTSKQRELMCIRFGHSLIGRIVQQERESQVRTEKLTKILADATPKRRRVQSAHTHRAQP